MPKMTIRVFIVAVIVLVIFFSLATLWAVKNVSIPIVSRSEYSQSTIGAGTYLAKIVSITDEGQITLGEHEQLYQTMLVSVLQGKYSGRQFSVTYGTTQLRSDSTRFTPEQKIYIVVSAGADGELHAYYADFDRSKVLLLLLFSFIVSVLALGRRKGLGSIVSLCFSMFIILGYIIPHILAGDNPVSTSLIGSGVLLGFSLYITYGWNLKTHASVISMIFTLIITGSLSALFVNLAHLNGYGDENALFLIQLSSVQINVQGLLLGSMIIGTLGILDDLVTSQSAAVVEIHGANPDLNVRQTFISVIRIGQDHVAATVNTLVLSYTGASLPLLLVFTLAQGSYQYLINSEMLAEEIVRTLVGSLGLVAAVPISSIVAAFIIVNQHKLMKLGEWRTLFGPETNDHAKGYHAH